MKDYELHYAIHDVVPYINWIYFFHAWGFPPRFATIARIHGCDACRAGWLAAFEEGERARAAEAMQLHKDAVRLLEEADADFRTHALVALYEANADGDDLVLFTPLTPNGQTRLPMLRQQRVQHAGDPYLCLTDFIRPLSQGIRDRAGVFAASVDQDLEHLYEEGAYADSYKHLLAQTLADRLAEATAEVMHLEVRRHYWGYAPDEHLSMDELLNEQYDGIRPAIGYPSLPDQTLNFELDRLIGFERIGIRLTEHGAMRPHASVSGLLLAHPQARYFGIGPIGEDQLASYAQRRGMDTATMRKYLAGNLR